MFLIYYLSKLIKKSKIIRRQLEMPKRQTKALSSILKKIKKINQMIVQIILVIKI